MRRHPADGVEAGWGREVRREVGAVLSRGLAAPHREAAAHTEPPGTGAWGEVRLQFKLMGPSWTYLVIQTETNL